MQLGKKWSILGLSHRDTNFNMHRGTALEISFSLNYFKTVSFLHCADSKLEEGSMCSKCVDGSCIKSQGQWFSPTRFLAV